MKIRKKEKKTKKGKRKEKGKKKKLIGGKGKWEEQRALGRVGVSHVTWPKPVSGAALIEAGDDGPRRGRHMHKGNQLTT